MSRVVITGLGAISACGMGAERLWLAARDGVSAVGPLDFERLPRQLVRRAAKIPDAVAAELRAAGNLRLQDWVSVLALAAAREAVAQAQLGEDNFGPSCGVIVGTGFGGPETVDRNVCAFAVDPTSRGDPMGIPKVMTNAPASWISMEFGARGATMCISTACSSATQALGLAFHLVRSGSLERCLAGGSEAVLVPSGFRAWELLRVMTPRLCRPFSAGRDGMVLGEGAGIVVIESLESARSRNAPIIAEIAGFGTTSDADDLLRPNPRGATDCMLAALKDARLQPSDIAYVNAHGTGTVANDQSEVEALRNVFGERLEDIPVSSTKPVHGHALGAAGALEFIIAVRALCEQKAPPTINFLDVDPRLGIDPVAHHSRSFSGKACLSNSFAFGGINASLIATRYG